MTTPSPNQPSSSSSHQMGFELDSIYNTYAIATGNNSVDTLNSDKDQAPSGYTRYLQSNVYDDELYGEISHVSRMQLKPPALGYSSNLLNQSSANDSGSNVSSLGGSFDFNPNRDNSSMNVLVGSADEPGNQNLLQHPLQNQPFEGGESAIDSSLSSSSSSSSPAPPAPAQDDWAAVKKVQDPQDESQYSIIKRAVEDFKFGRQLGEGSYSTVVLATDKHTHKKYAVKILDKRHIIKEKKVKYVNIEKNALNRLIDRTGIISLYFTFQDKQSLYFVLDYASNGELLSVIKKYGTLNEECTRHFGAQLLDAIKFMHDNGVIHRDIKPENILFDDKMRLQITDFGTARILEKKKKQGAAFVEEDMAEDYPVDVRAKSFVGTAEYVSPELLESKYCGKPGDIWAFGCIIYQMIAGKPPFKGLNEYQTFQKITKLQYAFSAGFPVVIRDLIKQILVLQPSRRATIPDIQQHYFFQGTKWDDFDLIWSTKHPEIGPYRMNAKAMMKVPELSKSNPNQIISPAQAQANAQLQAATYKRLTTSSIPSKKVSGKVNAASVAAYVLAKGEGEHSDDEEAVEDTSESSTPSSNFATNKIARPVGAKRLVSVPNSKTRQPVAADYIPGTNILRPTVNSQAIRTLTSTKKQAAATSSSSKNKSKVMEVTPLTPVENAWSGYLKHSDERVLKIGPVISYKQPTDVFERKNKGLLHDSPLGWYGTKGSGSSGRLGTSLLTQVANGSQGGLRSSSSHGSSTQDATEYDEEFAIIDHYSMTNSPKRSSSSASTNSKNGASSAGASNIKGSKSSLFKKLLLSSHHSSEDGVNGNGSSPLISSSSAHPLEKLKTCTMLITTHGRVLIFLRDDNLTNYKLIVELKLDFPFIHFKEVISSSSTKFLLKIIPTMGIFAIESSLTTFIFEVEKFDVTLWTEALARSKLNQQERVYEERNKSTSMAPSTSTLKSVSKPTTPVISQSNFSPLTLPNLLTSPNLSHSPSNNNGRSSPRLRSLERQSHHHQSPSQQSHPVKSSSREQKEPGNATHNGGGSTGLLASRMSKSIKRKPPPPIYPKSSSTAGGLNLSTGLPSSPSIGGAFNGTLYAAQKAVSDSNEKNGYFAVENQQNLAQPQHQRRSSYPKESSSVSSRAVNMVKNLIPQENTGPKPAITSLNSKFLSRSQRKK